MQVGSLFGWMDLRHRTVELSNQGDVHVTYNLDDLFALVKTMMEVELNESQRKLIKQKTNVEED